MSGEQDQGISMPRREFLKSSVVSVGAISAAGSGCQTQDVRSPAVEALRSQGRIDEIASPTPPRQYNGPYAGEWLNRVAFPLGGIGAGMICIEGTGALSHFSLRNRPEVFNEPCVFAAVCVKGGSNVARVVEGPVPTWKLFGPEGTGNGAAGRTYGLPRFSEATFEAKFPFAHVHLTDRRLPLRAEIVAWSPFEPNDADNSSLPAAGLEYRFTNPMDRGLECVFSFSARNFMIAGSGRQGVRAQPGGFVLWAGGAEDQPWESGEFSARVTDREAKVNCTWFRGGWWDPLTIAWNDVQSGACFERPPVTEGEPSPGATLFVPFALPPSASRTVTLQLAWYVAQSNIHIGTDPAPPPTVTTTAAAAPGTACAAPGFYRPWYGARFADVAEVAAYWGDRYDALRAGAKRFSNCLYDTSLPPEVMEAVAANLTILKSPTVLRQADGRLWCWEGCGDHGGCCHGSCTHVWNYAQALPHLFAALERTLRETEFGVSQDEAGHQAFRTALPIRPTVHDFHAAADGQLGGIMKVHRDWRIGGDTSWLRRLWPKIRASLDYCINTWDPNRKGILEEPHHNTYDIEFWGPDGMCTSFYLGALAAAVQMGRALSDDVSTYQDLLANGTRYAHAELFNGEYFFQQVRWEGLKTPNPLADEDATRHWAPEARDLFRKEGPKYQYGRGCLSDGVLGAWMAAVCGVGSVLDGAKVASHLQSVYEHNLRKDLSEHANPQRPSYACGTEGGLLLCTWPRGGKPSLPFVYSDEVWTGIEYQVASHLMMTGHVEAGLDIVRTCRDRYDGRVRNPFNEYECGHWYARAMSSYALLQGLTGARYDAVDKVLYLEPQLPGDFRAFLSTATGYGTVGVRNGRPFLDVRAGTIEVRDLRYTPSGSRRREVSQR